MKANKVSLAAVSWPPFTSCVAVEADNGLVRLQVEHRRPDPGIGVDLVDSVIVTLSPLVAAQLARALVDLVDLVDPVGQGAP